MDAMAWLTQVRKLDELLELDALTGVLRWRPRAQGMFADSGTGGAKGACARWNARFAGKTVGGVLTKGYLMFRLFGQNVQAHRIVWALHHGEWPTGEIDHINHDRADNRPSNLRMTTSSGNARNRSLSTSRTLPMGVYWREDRATWWASIKVNGKKHYLGSFATKSDAIRARKAAEKRFDFHENHGVAA